MSSRDYRCALSGVSLLGAEAALVLLERADESWLPASLPLFGIYDGQGTLTEMVEGPNAELLVERLESAMAAGRLSIDFDALGIGAQDLQSLEMALGLVALSQVGGVDAVRFDERPLGFAVLSGHVAAQFMDMDPPLDSQVTLESLPEHVFESRLGRSLYGALGTVPVRTRLRFGLSLVGLSALDAAFQAREISWRPQGAGLAEEQSDPARFLAEATLRFAKDEDMLVALEEYASQFSDEEMLD